MGNPVSLSESTADQASYGLGIDVLANPSSGASISIPSIRLLGTSGVTPTNAVSVIDGVFLVQGTSGVTNGVSGSNGSGFTSMSLINGNFVIQNTSGGATGIITSGLAISAISGIVFSDGGSGAATGGSGGSFSGKDPVCWARVMVCGTGFRVPLFT